ncbi:choice-of-anchor F family protein [Photobacterium rosenbergii]|uniref:choice-of-anchor F family protein n=1 Tax=Photobacterium rosenbergii TaxID=294936 RepID=UPI001C99B315|nr:choice-of-anchor F family protein [Photobacterium rosenbergii]MBY5944426.1 choice-of-anchor F family protein [Photobacterium rosenbergii]
MENDRPRGKFKLKSLAIFLVSSMLVTGLSIAKDPTPNLYLDVPAPILSNWNMDNVFTVDDTVDGFTGATAKTYIYSSVEDAEAAKNDDDEWGTHSVGYITWELDNGSGRAPGLQVLNDNLDYKYHNCIMASGEMEHPSFPDTIVSKACNDPQGSSKRVFLQLTKTETPVDLVFDLGVKDIRYKGLVDSTNSEDDSGSNGGSSDKENTIEQFREKYGVGRLYRVIQKVRNDTDKRVVSYKFELGTGVGDQFEALNFEEHGVGFEMQSSVPREFFDGRTGSAPDVDVWKTERFATFAPKLFDDGVRPRFSPGFLDHNAAGFMDPVYSVDAHWKVQNIDSGLSLENGIIGSLSQNFFSVNDTHGANLPYDMLGYMLPNSQVPSVIGYWLVNDIDAESEGVVAIWDGHHWRSGRAGLDGDPETLDDNFAIIPAEQLTAWADKPLGLDIPGEDPDELIRYAVIPSDDLAGLNTDIFIHIGEKLLDEQSQPLFESLTLRVTARSIDDVLPGVPGSDIPEWMKEGNAAPDLSLYATVEDELVALNDYVTTDEKTSVIIDALQNDLLNGIPVTVGETEISIVEEPINGKVEINTSQMMTYTPADYFTGNEVFKYQITFGESVSNLASVRVVVNPEIVLGAPVVINDNVMTMQETPVNIDVLANDKYTPGNQHMLHLRINNKPVNGDAYLNEDMEIVFTPAVGFSGIEQFTYVVEEDGIISNNGVVTVRVDEPFDDEPTPDSDSSGSSGGGCAIGDPNAPVDPTLPLLLSVSIIGLILRRHQND